MLESRPTSSSPVDLRDAFFDALYELAARDRRVMLLTDDQGAFGLARFRKELSGQYFNVGVAEQNLIAVAAGLALGGKVPVVYGIATFMTMRCCEQIRVDLCCMSLPVTIVGSGPGYTYGSDGPTHHATQDLAILRALAGITILSPADAVTTAACARLACASPGPTYVRLEKGAFPVLYDESQEFLRGFEVLTPGFDPMIISTGAMVHQALAAAEELRKHGFDAGVIDLYRVKPLATAALCVSLDRARRVVTLEETSIIGGIGSAVAELMVDARMAAPLRRLAGPDLNLYDYGPRDWLHARCGLDAAAITADILIWLKSSASQ